MIKISVIIVSRTERVHILYKGKVHFRPGRFVRFRNPDSHGKEAAGQGVRQERRFL